MNSLCDFIRLVWRYSCRGISRDTSCAFLLPCIPVWSVSHGHEVGHGYCHNVCMYINIWILSRTMKCYCTHAIIKWYLESAQHLVKPIVHACLSSIYFKTTPISFHLFMINAFCSGVAFSNSAIFCLILIAMSFALSWRSFRFSSCFSRPFNVYPGRPNTAAEIG